ncbi:MAG TPA: ROK family transcriptional regulator [Candidatus Limnocylindrales bacterium]|nr:ROK family transcriptional regulator [Candidatus Limnocylindrales bacterium]
MVAIPGKATHQQTRAHNAALVLRALYDHGPISRAEVARMSGLTRTTVGDLVSELLEEGMAREMGRGPSTGGKAPILLELVDEARHVVGLDLAELRFRGAVVDLRGNVVQTAEREVGAADGEEAVDLVHELIDELAKGREQTLLGIGVGAPGIVDAGTGTIRWAVNLNWPDLPLGDMLRERYGLPVQVANDSRAAALALQLFGERQTGTSNLVAITVGRGIGAGVVLGGELFHGDGFGAGEIGHTTVVEEGPECRCGRIGCLETVASSRALLRQALDAARSDPDGFLGSRLTDDGQLRLTDLVAGLAADDEATKAIVLRAGRYLGQVIGGLIGVLDVERIVLHGSVAVLGDPWLEAVRDEARRRSFPPLSADVRIDIAAPIGDLVVMGASALLLTSELGLAAGRAAIRRAA